MKRVESKICKEDIELFKLIELANAGNKKAKWEIVWKFNNLIRKVSKINGKVCIECQYYVENAVFSSIEKFETLKRKKF